MKCPSVINTQALLPMLSLRFTEVYSRKSTHVQMSFLLKRVVSPSFVNLPEGMITVSIHISFLGRKDSLLFRSKFSCSQKNKPKQIQVKNLHNIITDHISEILPQQ